MATQDSWVHFAGVALGRYRHICAFFNSVDEEYRVLRSFIKDGFDRGEKATYIVDSANREEHSKYNDPVICTYDLSKFGANVAMDIMRTHEAAIIGGVLQENPFFVPPDQFLVEMRGRRSAGESARPAS